MACVIMIGIGGSQGAEDMGVEISMIDLLKAVLCALGTGLVFSLNTLNINYVL
jgi:hypothetical protein